MNLRHTVLLAFITLMLFSPLVRAAESDDVWARALFLSACDTNITVEQAETLFLKALQKAERLDDFDKARKTYVSDYSAFLKSSSSLFDSETEVLKNFRKIEDHQNEEKETVLRLLKKTGLDTLSFEK